MKSVILTLFTLFLLTTVVQAQSIAPDPPTIGVVTAGLTTASVAFTPPAEDNSASVTRYTVWPAYVLPPTSLNSSGSVSDVPTTGASSPVALSGLTPGRLYTFSVTAESTAGISLASDPSAPFATQGGALVTTYSTGEGGLQVSTYQWQSDEGGSASITLPSLDGFLHRAVLGFGATAVPLNLYDATLTADDGVTDILSGRGANLTTATATSLAMVWSDGATTTPAAFPNAGSGRLDVLNAGAQRNGVAKIYFSREP